MASSNYPPGQWPSLRPPELMFWCAAGAAVFTVVAWFAPIGPDWPAWQPPTVVFLAFMSPGVLFWAARVIFESCGSAVIRMRWYGAVHGALLRNEHRLDEITYAAEARGGVIVFLVQLLESIVFEIEGVTTVRGQSHLIVKRKRAQVMAVGDQFEVIDSVSGAVRGRFTIREVRRANYVIGELYIFDGLWWAVVHEQATKGITAPPTNTIAICRTQEE